MLMIQHIDNCSVANCLDNDSKPKKSEFLWLRDDTIIPICHFHMEIFQNSTSKLLNFCRINDTERILTEVKVIIDRKNARLKEMEMRLEHFRRLSAKFAEEASLR